jgi:hypothetical protein
VTRCYTLTQYSLQLDDAPRRLNGAYVNINQKKELFSVSFVDYTESLCHTDHYSDPETVSNMSSSPEIWGMLNVDAVHDHAKDSGDYQRRSDADRVSPVEFWNSVHWRSSCSC